MHFVCWRKRCLKSRLENMHTSFCKADVFTSPSQRQFYRFRQEIRSPGKVEAPPRSFLLPFNMSIHITHRLLIALKNLSFPMCFVFTSDQSLSCTFTFKACIILQSSLKFKFSFHTHIYFSTTYIYLFFESLLYKVFISD